LSQRSRFGFFAFLLLLAAFLAPRLAYLSADPPDNLSVDSCSEYGDPGNYAFNARNKVVLGDSRIEELGAAAAAPIPHAVTVLSFRLFGTGTGSMNLVPLLFAVLLWLALWRLSSREFPEAQSLFFVLLALNYAFGSFSRVNDQVMPMTFFIVAGLLAFLPAWEKPRLFFPAALLFAGSFLSKPKIIYFLVAVLPLAVLLILIERRELRAWRLNAVRLAWFAGGALLVAVPWAILILRRYPAVFRNVGAQNAETMIPGNIGQALSYWILKPPFSFYPSNRVLTVVLFFALAGLLLAVFRRRGRPRIGALEIVCVTWTVVGLGIHSFIGYRPVRHYIEFTVPILILVSVNLVRAWPGFRLDLDVRRKGWVFAGLFVLYVSALSSLGRRFLSLSPLSEFDQAKVHLFFVSLGAAAVLAAGTVVVLVLRGGRPAPAVPRRAAVAFVILAVVVYAGQNIARLIEWLRQPSYNLRTIGRDLGAAFPDGVFAGLLVPSLSLENRNVAHTAWTSYANENPDFLGREGVTHLFLGTYNDEPAYYERAFPEAAQKARLTARFRMWRSWFLLYDLRPAPPQPPGTKVFEAEAMVRDLGLPGLPRFDAAASGRYAVRVEDGPPALLGREDLEVETPGPFRAAISVRLETPAPKPLRLQVKFYHAGGLAIERHFVLTGGPDADGAYRRLPFTGEFMTAGAYIVEVRRAGNGALLFDKIEIVR
jgi:4-amino-4-deoxy-L-arabinose transferase-like glycosyltransferase